MHCADGYENLVLAKLQGRRETELKANMLRGFNAARMHQFGQELRSAGHTRPGICARLEVYRSALDKWFRQWNEETPDRYLNVTISDGNLERLICCFPEQWHSTERSELLEIQLNVAVAYGANFIFKKLRKRYDRRQDSPKIRGRRLADAVPTELTGVQFPAEILVGDFAIIERFAHHSQRAFLAKVRAMREARGDAAEAAASNVARLAFVRSEFFIPVAVAQLCQVDVRSRYMQRIAVLQQRSH